MYIDIYYVCLYISICILYRPCSGHRCFLTPFSLTTSEYSQNICVRVHMCVHTPPHIERHLLWRICSQDYAAWQVPRSSGWVNKLDKSCWFCASPSPQGWEPGSSSSKDWEPGVNSVVSVWRSADWRSRRADVSAQVPRQEKSRPRLKAVRQEVFFS